MGMKVITIRGYTFAVECKGNQLPHLLRHYENQSDELLARNAREYEDGRRREAGGVDTPQETSRADADATA